jgi:hypothetical protein
MRILGTIIEIAARSVDIGHHLAMRNTVGTDIYAADLRWVGRSTGEFDSGVIFVPGPATWHGFDPRPIVGVTPADGDQLRPPGLARPRATCLS